MPPEVQAALTQHAGMAVPVLLWVVAALIAGLIATLTIIGKAILKTIKAHGVKLDATMSLLYGICLEVHPEHVDCETVRKALCEPFGDK